MLALLLVCLIIREGGTRFLCECERIDELPRIEDNPIISSMKRYSYNTKWTFARDSMYSFHANLLIIPELAVLPANRFWSGRITLDGVWKIIKKERPQQLLLRETLDLDTVRFVETNYRLVCEDGERRLYVARP
jgi:hypothetical protein